MGFSQVEKIGVYPPIRRQLLAMDNGGYISFPMDRSRTTQHSDLLYGREIMVGINLYSLAMSRILEHPVKDLQMSAAETGVHGEISLDGNKRYTMDPRDGAIYCMIFGGKIFAEDGLCLFAKKKDKKILEKIHFLTGEEIQQRDISADIADRVKGDYDKLEFDSFHFAPNFLAAIEGNAPIDAVVFSRKGDRYAFPLALTCYDLNMRIANMQLEGRPDEERMRLEPIIRKREKVGEDHIVDDPNLLKRIAEFGNMKMNTYVDANVIGKKRDVKLCSVRQMLLEMNSPSKKVITTNACEFTMLMTLLNDSSFYLKRHPAD